MPFAAYGSLTGDYLGNLDLCWKKIMLLSQSSIAVTFLGEKYIFSLENSKWASLEKEGLLM